MTKYKHGLPVHVAFESADLSNSLPQVISKANLKQFHISESEKYSHVTVFFDCRNIQKFSGEEWNIVTSPENTRNYSNHPEMSAEKLTEILTEKITKTEANFFVANYANPDMVGHTGNLAAAIDSVEYVDKCVKKVLDACLQADAALIITADHGNVEQMINVRTGDIDKDHTTNPVPLLLACNAFKFAKPLELNFSSLSARVPAGAISDVAPTILELFGLPKPPEMTGVNLLEYIDEVPVKLKT
jgi:2,3-bisphosphoglycerate-independent phosphoglycerate mutase